MGGRFGKPLVTFPRQIDHEPENGTCDERRGYDAVAVQFQLTGDRGVRLGDQTIAAPPHDHPVVSHQNPAEAADQRRSKTGLSAARWATKQQRAFAGQHRGGMQVERTRAHAPAAGSVTVNRAPAGAPLAGSTRFSAQITPRCTSTICREIDRPSPEFCPKP